MFMFSRKVFILFFLIFLSACQTAHQPQSMDSIPSHSSTEIKDSAPLGPIPTFFKAIIPKHEPLSPYGNPSTYRVYGKVYKVMPSAHGYKERGLASWYASKFHKQRTSSGEPYDMYALTAAHRTLPLPTYLKVKNLDNGREIIVKVNDRGPFHQGRLLDLSYGAAVKLGIFPKGTARVEIEAIATQAPHQAPRRGQYYLQVGAFQSKALAYQLKSKLNRFSRASVNVMYVRGRYIVKMGPFANAQASEQMKKQLRQNGINGAFSCLG
jgi:rare lipoprotein A